MASEMCRMRAASRSSTNEGVFLCVCCVRGVLVGKPIHSVHKAFLKDKSVGCVLCVGVTLPETKVAET